HFWMAEQTLRGENDQWFAEVALKLPAQYMEEVRWRGAVHDLHVIFSTKLQKTFYSRRRVLGALPLQPMGKQHHETVGAAPLGLCTGDVLVDDDLCTIIKITKLGFPHGQRLRVCQCVAVFKA